MDQKYLWLSLTPLFCLPSLVFAQAPSGGLQLFLYNIPLFLDNVIIPFLFGIAFLVFVWNVIRFFVIEGSNEEGRKKAKDLAIYSVAAFVFLMIFWGIVNMLISSLGFYNLQPCPDYIYKVDWRACP